MDDEAKLKNRDYHRKWRSEHPEQVIAAQARYWAKKAQKSGQSALVGVNVEDRAAGCEIKPNDEKRRCG